jgi:outer membrane receptor for ferrienterochelin and colicin
VRELQANRTGSSVYYKNDKKNEDRHYGSAEYSRDLSAISTLNAGVFYRNKSANSVRTFTNPSVILDPSTFAVIGLYDTTLYGDTKERELSTNQIGLNLQFNHAGRLGNMPNRLVAGLEGEYGHLTNKYYNSFTGFEGDYTQGVASRGTVIRDGKNSRLKLAAYASNEFHPFDPLTVSLGARFDAIRDRYDGALPDSSLEADNSAFSPKVGLNIRYLDSPDWAGNMYAAVNRSFKAATLDQLSDQRPIDAGSFLPLDTTYTSFMFLPVSVPPFSNASLKPQRGTSYEAGIYQRFKHLKGSHGELTLSVYQIDLKDEIDFDVATLKYQNIVHSRHRGVEAGLRLYWLPNLMTFFNHTWTSPTFRSGGYSGKFMKSIPRNITGLGLTYELASGLRTGLTWNFVGRIYLDDDNTMSLPDYSTGGFRLSYSISPVTVLLDIENLLDRKYSSTGYVLSGTTYLYPSAGRSFRGGIRVQLQ